MGRTGLITPDIFSITLRPAYFFKVMIMNDNKLIKEHLHLLAGKILEDIENNIKRLHALNHQAENYENMHEVYKGQVVCDLITDLKYRKANMDENWDLKELEKLLEGLQ